MQRKITQQGIAEALGLSLRTVQRSFADSDKVAAATKAHVRNYAAEVGYSPDRRAQSLSRGGERQIALFSSSVPSFFWDRVGAGVALAARQLREFGFDAVHRTIEPRKTAAYIRQLNQSFAEGLDAAAVVNNPEYDMARIFGFLDHHRIPYITLNIDAPETSRLCCVGPDYGEGGRIAAEFMGKTIRRAGRVLIIHNPVDSGHALAGAHVNEERLLQFVSYLSLHFPELDHQVMSFAADRDHREIADELESLLDEGGVEIQGIYSITGMHDLLGDLILRRGLENRYITVVHGLSPRTEIYLRSHAFTAAIDQHPLLQGYFAVKVLEHYLQFGRLPSPMPPISQRIVIGSSLGDDENFALLSALQSGY